MRAETASRAAALIGGAAMAWAASALAQVIPTVEEIVVTARKREQSIQEVPMAVAAIGTDALAAAGIDTMLDLSRRVPSLEMLSNTSPAQESFRLRRVGNLGNIGTFEPAVGVFVDGAFRLNPVFVAGELFDIARVEVLRGPQGALYGKNTTAGVLAVYTAEPATERAGDAAISLGVVEGARDAASRRFRGALSGPLASRLYGGVAVSAFDQEEAWTSALVNGGEDANGRDRIGIRGQVLWNASVALDLRLIVSAIQEDDRQMTEDITYDPDGYVSGIVLPTLQAAGVSDACTDNDPHNRRHCLIDAWRTDLGAREATLLTEFRFANDLRLNAVTSWDDFEFKGTADDPVQIAAPVLRLRNTLANTSVQQDIRITSPGGESLDWLVGVFYFESEHEHGDSGNRPILLFDELSDDPTLSALHRALFAFPDALPFATQGQVGTLDSGQRTEYLSIYGNGTWQASDRFALGLGLRRFEEDKEARVVQSTNDPSPSILSLLLSPAAVSATGLNRSASELTWSVTGQWFASETAMVFATVAHGFKSGGFNVGFGALPIADREFGDEDIGHVEIGLKAGLWQDRLRLAASVFRTDYDQYQDAAFIGAQFTVGNAERVDLEGIEIEATAVLGSRLTLELAASYADLVYARNAHGVCYPGRVPDSPTDLGACDLSGERPVNAPKLKTHVGVSYGKPTAWGSLFARLDWSRTGAYNTSFSADPRLRQEAYDWVNIRTGARLERFEISVWIENLLDATVVNYDAVLNVYTGDNSFQSYLQPPRSFGTTLGVRFN
jgi:outer membrane receptor protein involved in Fe transport